jgi:hypothetical protein
MSGVREIIQRASETFQIDGTHAKDLAAGLLNASPTNTPTNPVRYLIRVSEEHQKTSELIQQTFREEPVQIKNNTLSGG